MEETANTGYAELLTLKAANDNLRERGRQSLTESIERLAAEMAAELGVPVNDPAVQGSLLIARQDWQFEVKRQTMVGERLGVRLRERTLVIETGWPRLPEHGYVPNQGLARGRVSFSPNVMIDPLLIDELILKRQPNSDPVWHVIANEKLGEALTEAKLREYLQRLRAV